MQANLEDADLRSANLYNASLKLSNLQRVKLTEANLDGARFDGAFMRDAEISAPISEAQLCQTEQKLFAQRSKGRQEIYAWSIPILHCWWRFSSCLIEINESTTTE